MKRSRNIEFDELDGGGARAAGLDEAIGTYPDALGPGLRPGGRGRVSETPLSRFPGKTFGKRRAEEGPTRRSFLT
ncbi:MAG: hypothetical protein NWE79_02020 [Candidatus Bathyarchaeota archaeon]|nr:hypothetical protein [Candidatus Bathyarchaeota archaeon]